MAASAARRRASTLVPEPANRWRDDPVGFCREALGVTPEPWQILALEAIARDERVAIRSGHGVGKSALLAWLVLWFLLTRFPAKIPCTAPTGHQLSDVLWGEIAKWHRRLIPELRDQLDVKSTRVERSGAPQECFAVARTARREQPEAFQGFHSENLLLIADEASGIDDAIFEVGEGAMSTPGAKTVLAGNPTRTSGYFFDAFHRARGAWATQRVSCLESGLVAPRYADNIAQRYGLDGNVYRVRVLGEFPTAEDDAVIPLDWCESAVRRDVEVIERARVVWGVDVARYGSDRSALAKRRGNILLAPVTAWQGKSTMEVVGEIANAYAEADDDETPDEILVDEIGIGAGVVDRLRELKLPVRGINVGESPSDKARFERRRDELWWRAREWFEARNCSIAPDQDLIAELALPKYRFTSSGQLQIESKADMKERRVQSPDLADAFCLTFAAALRTAPRERKRYSKLRRRLWSWMGV
jgi:phage terminase large subunit